MADLLVVGEAPGEDEDKEGEPFVGRAGQLLTSILAEEMGLGRDDVYITNVVKCRPPDNRDPRAGEVAACRPFLVRQIELVNPRVVVALGTFAAQTLLCSAEPMTLLRGRWRNYQGICLMPTYHPAYLLRRRNQVEVAREDFRKVAQVLGDSS